MKHVKRSSSRPLPLLGVTALLLTWWSASPIAARGQVCTSNICPGDNAVYPLSSGPTNSHSFIDASQLSGPDICSVINAALNQLITAQNQGSSIYNKKGVIDARGVNPSTACATGPWDTFSYPSNPPPFATVLLPAGTIQIKQPWTLPDHTTIIGEGSCLSGSCTTLTTIQAGIGFPSGKDLIDMGSSTLCPQGSGAENCEATGIEHLRLDGGAGISSVNGIVNLFSEELSHVTDVAMTNITGIGLHLGTSSGTIGNLSYTADASNSGPYSNIYISTSGTCVKIEHKTGSTTGNLTNSTRGIHGLTCSTSNPSAAAIYVDGPNNSLEDVTIQFVPTNQGGGTPDGIWIGSQEQAHGNVLVNISGTNLTNVIQINNAQGSTICPQRYNVCDLTILGVTASAGSNAIEDELPGGAPSLSQLNVGMYVVGEALPLGVGTAIGISRFSTSTQNLPTWVVGTQDPTGSSCVTGSLYSCIATGGNVCRTLNQPTLWGCSGSTWKIIR
jgi:hypothetical protein